jgi:hypothetical protein
VRCRHPREARRSRAAGAAPAHPPARLIAAAARVLCLRGWLDPDDACEWPAGLAAELTALARQGRCRSCPAPLTPDALADHWEARKQDEYERSLPAWSCDCGALYKLITEAGDGSQDQFWTTTGEDGLLGELAGTIRRYGSGYGKRKTKSGTCPACKRPFAETIARQAGPWQLLF